MSDTGPWTVRRLMEWTPGFLEKRGVDSPRLSAELLLAHVLNLSRIKLYTQYERPLAPPELDRFRDLVKRAGEDEPIAYLTGRAPFFNLEFEVTHDVLIPRPDTETIVENALQLSRHESGFEAPRVLDLCTGSGCIACAVAFHLKTATVLATDISEPAIAAARRNVERLGLTERVQVEAGDLFAALARVVDARPLDLIVANPPYIASSKVPALDKSVRSFEPLSALNGGPDGLALHRRIFAEGSSHLRVGGRMFLEIAFDQGPGAMDVARSHPQYDEARILKDQSGNDRVLAVRRVAGSG
ncbi:MAG: peptide chain release factor N(5)-glutamine methyltransferase [Tepidisphaeraceae bacterium]